MGSANAADATAVHMADVRFTWPGRNSFALSVAGFFLGRGERLLLTGPSGSGKSTLLSLIAGVVRPDEGSVEVLGTRLEGMSGPARDRFRAEHQGIVFQMFNLLPYLTVMDNVLLPLRFAPGRRQRAEARSGSAREEARRMLDHLHLEPALARQRAATLSVGQQQRVAAARALIGSPEIVIADEPTSSLDRDHPAAFIGLLSAELARSGATLLMVSHDPSLRHSFDRVLPVHDVVVAPRADVGRAV
jgi:putative ABC transport system ATP-binding protein